MVVVADHLAAEAGLRLHETAGLNRRSAPAIDQNGFAERGQPRQPIRVPAVTRHAVPDAQTVVVIAAGLANTQLVVIDPERSADQPKRVFSNLNVPASGKGDRGVLDGDDVSGVIVIHLMDPSS